MWMYRVVRYRSGNMDQMKDGRTVILGVAGLEQVIKELVRVSDLAGSVG